MYELSNKASTRYAPLCSLNEGAVEPQTPKASTESGSEITEISFNKSRAKLQSGHGTWSCGTANTPHTAQKVDRQKERVHVEIWVLCPLQKNPHK